MLKNFKVKNFKSFIEEANFSLNAEKIQDINYSVLNEKIDSKIHKILCSSVIYGPNAAGKTSLINAMSCFKELILRGNIKDDKNNESEDHVSRDMSLIPFFYNKKDSPVEFEIEFIEKGYLFKYKLNFIVNIFFANEKYREIIFEELSFNDTVIFKRTKDDLLIFEKGIEKLKQNNLLLEKFNFDLAMKNVDISKSNLDKELLFLTSDFDSFFSKKIPADIINWLKEKLIIINRSNSSCLRPKIDAEQENAAFVIQDINNVARAAGIVGTDFGFAKENDKIKTVTLFNNGDNQNGTAYGVPSQLIESLGTIRLVGFIPYVFNALINGGTLVVDELDTSFHPMIAVSIVNAFHNNEINVNKAQLIFNTHNPIFLNNQIFRRDEIKFVEKNKESKASIIYSLSDFKTNGEISVRNTTDYMSNYFVNKYGAIENIDFSDVFMHVVKSGEKNGDK